MFNKWDNNPKDNRVSPKEFRVLYNDYRCSNEGADKMFTRIDTDGSGNLSVLNSRRHGSTSVAGIANYSMNMVVVKMKTMVVTSTMMMSTMARSPMTRNRTVMMAMTGTIESMETMAMRRRFVQLLSMLAMTTTASRSTATTTTENRRSRKTESRSTATTTLGMNIDLVDNNVMKAWLSTSKFP